MADRTFAIGLDLEAQDLTTTKGGATDGRSDGRAPIPGC